MKKSIFALSAAAALAGFAGSAHAVYFFGAGDNTHISGAQVADQLRQNPGGTGHVLFTPYYSAQGTNVTMINITNTDESNGKAVKVRFRGAANSDDVLDFTVLMSAGDVWTASIQQNVDGRAMLKTADTTCTIPTIPSGGVPFITQNLRASLSDDAKAAHTREGYIEILNMADIKTGTDLYKAIDHGDKGKPSGCGSNAVRSLLSKATEAKATDLSKNYGLYAASGQLMGSWAILNSDNVAVFSDAMPAIQAYKLVGAVPTNGVANVLFSPQTSDAVPGAVAINSVTADPVLVNANAASFYDLPDMSTPLVDAIGISGPVKHLSTLATAFNKVKAINEYAVADSPVPMATDWVFSQPTRRYYAAVKYEDPANGNRDTIYFLTNVTVPAVTASTSNAGSVDANSPYKGLALVDKNSLGNFTCRSITIGLTDREERGIAASGGEFSPGRAGNICGEVFTVTFGANSPLLAALTNLRQTNMPGTEGWGFANFTNAVPVTGFAGTSAKDGHKNYGITLPHRF